jgi:hypothetical protein
MFIKLPIPVDESVPEGYSLIVAYAKDDTVVVPLDLKNLPEDHHNCDWEGCTSLSHVVKFNITQKYKSENELEKREKQDELSFYFAEKQCLIDILATVPETHVIDRSSWQHRLNEVESRIKKIQEQG